MIHNNQPPSRRQFVTRTALAAASASFTANAALAAPFISGRRLEKPTLLGIGAGGKGKTDLEKCSQAGFEVIALCDVIDIKKFDTKLAGKNERRVKALASVRASYPNAVFGSDYRQMLPDLADKVDAVVVATPDHHHFHASVLAMQAGKHVYCQKPLTHGIWEARMMRQVAAATGVVTQMGNQAHAHDHMRRCVELIRAGIIGKITAIHTWTNRPIWPQGFGQPPEPQKVPAGIDWKQWTGPAPDVKFNPVIAPFAWRGWWNYGTGALGDMACHIMDVGYWSMNPGSPIKVRASQNGATEISPPINSNIVWDFAANEFSHPDGFSIHWYDGYLQADFARETWELVKHSTEYNHPGRDVLGDQSFENFGSVIIGEAGKLFFNRNIKKNQTPWVLQVAGRQIEDFQWPEPSLPRAKNQDNYLEWYDAIQGNIASCQSNFDHAGPFTETILLGVLAQRASTMNGGQPEELSWDEQQMKVAGRPDLDALIRRPYSAGWDLDPSS